MKKQKTIAICLTDEQIAFIDEMASAREISRSMYIRDLIKYEMEIFKSDPDELRELQYDGAPGLEYKTLQELNEIELRQYMEGLNDVSKTSI